MKAGGGFAKFEGYPEEDSEPSADELLAATPPKIPVWDGATQAHKDAVFALISDLESLLVSTTGGEYTKATHLLSMDWCLWSLAVTKL